MTKTAEAPKVTYDRQVLLLDPGKAEKTHCHIFGCGTVGSNAAVELARLGIGNLTLHDFDEVEAHNLPSQRFFVAQLGQKKVLATTAQIKAVANDTVHVTANDQKVEGPLIVDGPIVCSVDSMESRKHIFENIAKPSLKCNLFIDVRMAGNTLQVYALNPQSREECENYAGTLYSDKEAEAAPCGGRTVSYTGAISGGIVAAMVRARVQEDAVPPFFWSFDLKAFDAIRSIDS